ncbi:MAG TPA: hypothetical protein VJV39_14225 [Dongiaceae bacterium]|nr:hypothetical protein [Dongiaceae bacterium]
MRLRTVLVCLLLLAPPAMAAESLPMPVARYAELCMQSGGGFTAHLSSGIGIVRCAWSDHGRTECKVGSNTVNICGISCQSNACLKANPARYTPTWPLAGGPNSAALPASPGGTLAPAN